MYPEGIPRRICKKDLIHPIHGEILKKGVGYLTTPDVKWIDGVPCVRVFARFWFWITADEYFEGCEHFNKDALVYEI